MNTRLTLYRGAAAAALVLLSSCGSGGGGDGATFQPICRVIGNGSDISAVGVEEPVLGFDGHLDSYATLGPADSASGTLGGGGVYRPGYEFAGVAFTTPASGVVSVSIRTYLGDVPRDNKQAATLNYSPTGEASVCPEYCTSSDRTGQSFVGIPTLASYDRIEATLTVSGLDQPLQIRELCIR